jgi:hypothetical protein
MKYIMLLTAISTISVNLSFGQSLDHTVNLVQDKSVTDFIKYTDTLVIKKATNFAIHIFRRGNGPGSAQFKEGSESTHNVIIAVSEYDEFPDTKVFSIGPFYAPKIVGGKDLKDHYEIEIDHGPSASRVKTRMLVFNDRVTLRN